MLGIPFLDDAVTKWFKPQSFDDPVDRLNYFITATLLTFFALMVSAKQYVGAPIQCWMPMEFKGGWEQYAEDYCFIQNTYYVAPEEEIPIEPTERDQRQFGYYQWVPVVLALQAVMFYLPNWIWKTLHQQSGIDLSTAITDARKLRSLSNQERRQEISKLVTYVNECLETMEERRSPRRVFCIRVGRSLGSYVSTLYLGTKLLYLLNVFGQFFLLNTFIGRDYNLWGWTALTSLWTGSGWQDSPVFPRVSLCDFRVRRLANMHRYTVQCVLMINMFNEKIYLFIWFWFLFVALSTIVNFLYCVISLVPPSARVRSVRGWLKQDRFHHLADSRDAMQLIDRFTNHALRPDGILLLRFIEGHAGAIVARDLCARLFTDYCDHWELIYRHQRHPALSAAASKAGGGLPPSDSHLLKAAALSSPPHQSAKSASTDPSDEGYYHEKSGLLEPDGGGNGGVGGQGNSPFLTSLKPKHV